MKIDRIDQHSKRYVIADIHGCYKTLRYLVEEMISPSKSDYLFFLGDYIDRGPNSSGVIDYVIDLIDNGYKVFPLRGNHEENLLKAYEEYDSDTFSFFVKKINKSVSLLDKNNKLKEKYYNFFSHLEYYYELDDFIIVHAGINFNAAKPFEDYTSMLELRVTLPDKKIINNKKIVVGHQVTYLNDIIKNIENRNTILPIDNGCFYTKPHKIYDINQTGHLCCLELNSFKLIYSKNIEYDS